MIPFAHASITAEGDSAVLMQKVSKEYVDDYSKKLVSPPSTSENVETIRNKKDIIKTDTLMNLIKLREAALLNLLTDKTVKNNKDIFTIWMLNESDLIQELAATFGERICLEETIEKMKGSK